MDGKHISCDRKTTAFVTGILFMVISTFAILFLLFLTEPDFLDSKIILLVLLLLVAVNNSLLRQVYFFGENNKTPVILFISGAVLLEFSCILLIVGLLKNDIKLVLAWLVIMIVFWNINLVISIISIINFIVVKLANSIPFRSLALLAIQAAWLMMIGIVYCYWRNLTDIRDLPSLIEYFERKRAESESGDQNPNSPARPAESSHK